MVKVPPTRRRLLSGDESWEFAADLADKFLIEREIGRGTWGLVLLAHDRRMDRRVALKVLRPEYAGSVSADRFRREIEIVSQLHHPNIVGFYDSGDVGGLPWYTMPFVEGETLKARLAREGPLPIGEALRIARAVADALAHAHAHVDAHGEGVVHRDIKPANILLSGDDVLVVDFGIARAITRSSDDESFSSSGAQIGTVAYMSPEQGAADCEIDGRSDIYALGIVLYEMLAGEAPFQGKTTQAVIARHLLDPVPPLGTVRRSVPKSVAEIVYRALAKARVDRFQTAAEFARAIEAVEKDPAVSVAGRPRRKRRRIAIGAGLAAALLLGAWLAAAATVKAADARALAAADTTRVAVFPFERSIGLPPSLNADRLMRRGLLRWSGVEVVDPFALSEAMGARSDGEVSASRARALAVRLRAGRYIRGSVARDGDSVRVHAMLFDVSRGDSPLEEGSGIALSSGTSLELVFGRIADRLLVRPASPAAVETPEMGTASLAARQSYLQGVGAMERWDLDAADSEFAAAVRFDPHYARAALWLVLARLWADKDTATWRYALEIAASGRSQLGESERAELDAMSALARGDTPQACALWDTLTRREPFDFAAWYGSAHCLLRDQVVVPDPASPSGFSFRSGRHSAFRRYRRALALRPALLRALRTNAFSDVRELLLTTGNDMRLGLTAAPRREYYGAMPSWDGDTLCFVPFPLSVVGSSDPVALRRLPRTNAEAVDHQRQLFRDIAAGWAAAQPSSAEALHALALALFLLDEPSALDTLLRAKALATDATERQRAVATEVWIRVQFALPGDTAGLRVARTLADSLLRSRPSEPIDPQTLASLAALTGHVFDAVSLERNVSWLARTTASSPVKHLSHTLELYAAFGGPPDSVWALERRTDSLIAALELPAQRSGARLEALGHAAVVAFPVTQMNSVSSFAESPVSLLEADAAFVNGDLARVRRILANLQSVREAFAIPELTLDALYPEAWLLAAMGDTLAAERHLDPTLRKIRVSSALVDPVQAAMLVRAMAFRAELAARAGDMRTAALWARPVVELWANADDFLQPLVARMRLLAK